MDSHNRCIPGIIYIPNYKSIQSLINNYDFTKNDMINLAEFYKREQFNIELFPIIHKSNSIYNKNFTQFNSIFDGAAIGQYLGGVDPRNIPGDTTGFINETCEVKYNKYNFKWIKHNSMWFPYLQDSTQLIPINNLHIHSKKLSQFSCSNPIENKYITK
jgi:hypothetical protein